MQLIVKEKGHAARTVHLSRGDMVIGRSRQADIRLENFYASGKHCMLQYDGTTLKLHDLSTTNGTFYNGQKIDETLVREGDRILVGTALILVTGDDAGPNLRQLAAQYDEGDALAREQVVGMLGELADPSAVDLLRQALQDESAPVRETAAAALGSIGAPGAGAELAACLGDDEPGVRQRATWALIRTADTAAVPPLIDTVLEGSDDARVAAINVLGMLRVQQSSSAMIRALTADTHRVREAAVKALGALGDVGALPHLVEALAKPDRFPMLWVVEALGALRDLGALPHLVEQLDYPVVEVREAAAHALGQVWSRQSITHLIGALQDPSASVRRSAAASLERIRRSLDPDPTTASANDSTGGTLLLGDIGESLAALADGTGPVTIQLDIAYWQRWWAEVGPRLPAGPAEG